MSQEEVISHEDTNLFLESLDILAYEDTVAGLNCLVSYYFKQDQLIEAQYSFELSKDDYTYSMLNYKKVKEFLIAKYGLPLEDKEAIDLEYYSNLYLNSLDRVNQWISDMWNDFGIDVTKPSNDSNTQIARDRYMELKEAVERYLRMSQGILSYKDKIRAYKDELLGYHARWLTGRTEINLLLGIKHGETQIGISYTGINKILDDF